VRWLAIYLPRLPLEALAVGGGGARPLVVVEGQRGRQLIVLCNAAATAAGITPGMRSGVARALSAGLEVRVSDEQRELSALEGVAIWAGKFSSQVVLDVPGGILLELGGSLRLFGGVDRLLPQIRAGLHELGYTALLSLAPTPAGAMLLASDGREDVLDGLQGLRKALLPLPLRRLPLASGQQDQLGRLRLKCVGDLLRLPAADLGSRLGQGFMDYLEQLLGRSPDPRSPFQPPTRFQRQLELPAEVQNVSALLFASHRLLLELSGFLIARQAGTQHLLWHLQHATLPATRFRLGLLSPERNPKRFQILLQERLERVLLPAPVTGIGLRVEDIRPLATGRLSLLRDEYGENGEDREDRQLLERLQARLGKEAVSCISLVSDHRPERAWCRRIPKEIPRLRPAGPGQTFLPLAPRPLWLLAEPLPLEMRDGWPWLDGRLELEPERERIESGWWDGRLVARDYFVACSPEGKRFWIYRDIRGKRGWYLHGFF